jgi:hypothetical protein
MDGIIGFVEHLNSAAKISMFAAFISAGAATFTIYFAFKNFRRETINQTLTYVTSKQKYFEDLRKWADELTDILSEAVHLCELDPKRVVGEAFFDRRMRIRTALSSMIDRGRWFFPNVDSGEHGRDKPLAFRGYRHEVLDSLVMAYNQLTELNYKTGGDAHCRGILVQAKRQFVSQIQKVLDPVRRQEEFEKITQMVSRNFENR